MKKTYTVKQLADALGFSTNTVYKYLEEGKIKATRVEKEGRFRIPESEVVRLLGLKEMPLGSEKSDSRISSESQSVRNYFSDRLISRSSEFSEHLTKKFRVSAPSFLDWFAATLSIFLGLSHFLFPSYILSMELEPYKNYIAFVKLGLIGFGIFLLATDIFKPSRKFWRRLAHIQLGVLFLLSAVIFYQANLYAKVVGDGAIALLLIFTAFTKLSDKARFVIFINLLAIFASFIFVSFPQSIEFPLLAEWIARNQLAFGFVWYGLIALVLFGSIIGFYKGERFIIFGAFIVGAGSLTYAILTFGQGFWEGVVYNIVLASYIFLLPFWKRLENFTSISKRQLIEGFSWFVVVITIGLSLVFYLQSSFKSYAAGESKKSLETAIVIAESFIEQAKLEVERFKHNSELISLLENKNRDDQKLIEAAKGLLLRSGTLRRVLIYDASGRGVAVYPSDPGFQDTDFSDRDYFREAKNTKKTILGESLIPSIKGPSVVVPIATPILDDKDEVLAVIAGSVDLTELSLRLSEVKFGSGGYFIVACRNKRIVIHPEDSNLYNEVIEGSILTKALKGESGQIEDYDHNGVLQLQTYAPVSLLGWGILSQQPIGEIYRHQSTVSFVIFLMTIVMGVGSLLAIIYYRR